MVFNTEFTFDAFAQLRLGALHQVFSSMLADPYSVGNLLSRFAIFKSHSQRRLCPAGQRRQAFLQDGENLFPLIGGGHLLPEGVDLFDVVRHDQTLLTASQIDHQVVRDPSQVSGGGSSIKVVKRLLQDSKKRFLRQVFRLVIVAAKRTQIPPDPCLVGLNQASRLFCGICQIGWLFAH